MAYIIYEGIDSRFSEPAEMVNSSEFRAILTSNPHLRLVEVQNYDCLPDPLSGKTCPDITYREIILPLPEKYSEHVEIQDTKTNKNMWILFDDQTEVEDPSPEFIEILKIMDAYSLKTRNKRIFETPLNFKNDDTVILSAEYDFTTGGFKLEKNQQRNQKPNDKNANIKYAPLSHVNFNFINSQKMRDFISHHPYLKVVYATIDYNTGELLFTEAPFPVSPPEPDNEIMIIDERWNYPYLEFLSIFNEYEEGFASINDPSPEFVEFLKMMDVFSIKTLNKRIFEAPLHLKKDDPEILSAKFDFQKGTYKLEENS